MWLSSESGQGRLTPEPVLLTPALHSLKFTVDTAGLMSSLKLSSFKSLMRLDTEISLCVREDVPLSESELVHADLHSQFWGRGCCGAACQPQISPSFPAHSSL